ncbi:MULTISPECIES: helix-turn-helix transcriptional regulator [unclassified Mycobacterium]|uniref:helix-turn-helix domain-containing protein n=1 Tax=unclassified Mycobacterium TaxID=2642494 RepID=UPI0029C85B59|nr:MULTISPECIES: helix-turn-helix transcriptional regulator [unclassified Mycobacterium]
MPTRPSQHDPDRAARWEKTRKAVGARIRALRLERGLTQEEVALDAGVARHMLVQVELGQRGLLYERLFDIAKALHVPASTLFEDL